MDRRTFLSVVAAGVPVGVSGCSSISGGNGSRTAPPTEQDTSPVDTVAGVDLPVPEESLVRGASKDRIPAITEPVFGDDWSGVSVTITNNFKIRTTIQPRLGPRDRVIGVTRRGSARAYPLRILNWHEIVNDSFDGPLLVTYCPLCRTGISAERTVNDTETTFGVSGLLWNSNLVMYDELTESLWSQASATAIRGPETGTRLSLVPSTLTTWEQWQVEYPETTVLRPPPESNTVQGGLPRDYRVSPYPFYDDSDSIGVDRTESPERIMGLHPKTEVIGVAVGGESKAYPLPTVAAAGVVNDQVGGLPIMVAVAADDRTLVAYDRRVQGTRLTFERATATRLRAGGSQWSIVSGTARDGPFEGAKLRPATKATQMFWFSWLDLHPKTGLYQPDG